MSKRIIRSPFLVVNPKAYLHGLESLELAMYTDKLAIKYDIDVLFTGQLIDLQEIAQSTERIIVTAQHIDGIKPGKGMGHVLAEGLAEKGVGATFLNHAECPLTLGDLYQSIQRANENDILTIVCANTLDETKALSILKPDIMVCEQTELIGTGKVADASYMRETNEAVKGISPETLVLQAAGISTGDDVYRAIKLGADGSGGTSGIVLDKDPKLVIEEMIQALVRARDEKEVGK